MTIYEIKARVLLNGSHYFDRKTLKFFGQTLRMFSVSKMPDGRYQIHAPFGPGKPRGASVAFFNPANDHLERGE